MTSKELWPCWRQVTIKLEIDSCTSAPELERWQPVTHSDDGERDKQVPLMLHIFSEKQQFRPNGPVDYLAQAIGQGSRSNNK